MAHTGQQLVQFQKVLIGACCVEFLFQECSYLSRSRLLVVIVMCAVQSEQRSILELLVMKVQQ